MSDLISRQDVIDFLQITRDSEYKKSMSAECKHKSVVRSKHDAHVAFCDYLIEYVKQVPTHSTPSNTLGALDCVERAEAIKAVKFYETFYDPYPRVIEALEELPSVQPRRGKWIRTRTLMHEGELYCDQCDQEHPEQKKIWNFCPNCGSYNGGEQTG